MAFKISTTPSRTAETRTEFFEYDEDLRQIEWKTKKVISLEFGQVNQWLESRGYTRDSDYTAVKEI